MNIKEAHKLLDDCKGDWEIYHEKYDKIITEKLKEYDPKFIEQLESIALQHDASFWFA